MVVVIRNRLRQNRVSQNRDTRTVTVGLRTNLERCLVSHIPQPRGLLKNRVLGIGVPHVVVLFSRLGHDAGMVETADPEILDSNIPALQTQAKISLAGPQQQYRRLSSFPG